MSSTTILAYGVSPYKITKIWSSNCNNLKKWIFGTTLNNFKNTCELQSALYWELQFQYRLGKHPRLFENSKF